MIVGNDISKWQGDIDFEVYSKNTHFLIVKASEGVGYIDPKLNRNQTLSRQYNIPLGYYHFARPDLKNAPEKEADWFLQCIGEIREGEVLCLDYEPASNPFDTVTWCKAWLDRVLSKTGCKPLIYLNQSQVRGFDWKPVVDANYALWLACYDGTEDGGFTGQWGEMAMKQWTSKQQVPGISGNVDGNYFYGTVEQLKAYGYHKPVTPSSSPSASASASQSASQSPSASSTPSRSQSPSSSPSPSPEIDYSSCEEKLQAIGEVIRSRWTWFGSNSWTKKLRLIRELLYA